jgi:hypothetical protein
MIRKCSRTISRFLAKSALNQLQIDYELIASRCDPDPSRQIVREITFVRTDCFECLVAEYESKRVDLSINK